MTPSPNTEARKRRDEKATPEPVTPPEPYVLTTMEQVRRIGSGEVTAAVWLDESTYDFAGWDVPRWDDSTFVLWRPSPPRKVTIELDEDVVRRWAGGPPDDLVLTTDPAAITSACRAALDGDK
jgi:hypothetical protein